MSTLESIVDAIKALGAPPMPKRIVVDAVMMRRLEAEVPLGRGTHGAFAGVPIFVDNEIGDDRGYIEHIDGRIEKFGKWPATKTETPE